VLQCSTYFLIATRRCYSVLQSVLVCCSMLQCSMSIETRRCCSVLQSVLQCVAVCCSALQCGVCIETRREYHNELGSAIGGAHI